MIPRGRFYRGWKVAVCAGSGPSLSDEQIAIITAAQQRGLCRVAVTNGTWRDFPTADILYAADDRWWVAYREEVLRGGFRGELWTRYRSTAAKHGLHWMRPILGDRLPLDPDCIATGGNSGQDLIQIVQRLGATSIALVGYDMQQTGGKSHRHGDYPPAPDGGDETQTPTNEDPAIWVPRFAPLAADLKLIGVDVVNCTIDTALYCFRRSTIEVELAQIGEPAQLRKLTEVLVS